MHLFLWLIHGSAGLCILFASFAGIGFMAKAAKLATAGQWILIGVFLLI